MNQKVIIFSKRNIILHIEILNGIRYITPIFPLEGIYWCVDVVRNDVYIN